jgi:TIR domain
VTDPGVCHPPGVLRVRADLDHYPRIVAADNDLKVFISWSGTLAEAVTNVLRDWLPKMFDNINPWASDVDIVAGTRGFEEIKKALDDSDFGIIVITPENMEKPWLNFEAGALSKRLDGDPERVVPLLVNFDNPYQLKTPVGQFQAVMLNEDGMRRLCRSIASSMDLPLSTISARFEWAWPDLAKSIDAAKERAGNQPEPPSLDEKDLLKQLLARVDALQRTESRPQTAPSRPKRPQTVTDEEIDAALRIAKKYGLNEEVRLRPASLGYPPRLLVSISAANRAGFKTIYELQRELALLGVEVVFTAPE